MSMEDLISAFLIFLKVLHTLERLGIVVFAELRFTFLLEGGAVAGGLGVHTFSRESGEDAPRLVASGKRAGRRVRGPGPHHEQPLWEAARVPVLAATVSRRTGRCQVSFLNDKSVSVTSVA